MTSKVIRRNIVFKSEKQVKDFEKFVKEAGLGSFSHMCRYSIIETMKRYYDGSSEETKQLNDKLDSYHDSLYKKFELFNERVELISMRINKEGITSEVGHAINDIQKLLLHRDMDHGQILAKCKKYDDKTKDTALSLLLDAENIGTYK
jgi:hypothetical protein